ncbi:hypothetical protein L6452_17781 [Arctium lappa]|uniref:Uncharacterized protein n=1 Tax=Arctium lappa TaxID=4217 RepID=A0ACB9C4E5_ARCLA|nr:hypothetical protein L6452_17781 [Arctium lappa]
MMLGKIGRRIRIGTSERLRFVGSRRFSTNNKPTIEPNKNGEKADGSLTHHDSYRDLDKLDFMTAAKILFTTPPKQKKFGLDFHLVQLFFVCLPSLAVYLVAQYARHEMKKMDAELEKRRIEEVKKTKAAEGEALQSNPQLLEVKERLDSLEKSVKEIMIESKNQRNIKVSDQHEGDRKHHASNPVGENRQKKQETYDAGDQKGPQGGLARDEK